MKKSAKSVKLNANFVSKIKVLRKEATKVQNKKNKNGFARDDLHENRPYFINSLFPELSDSGPVWLKVQTLKKSCRNSKIFDRLVQNLIFLNNFFLLPHTRSAISSSKFNFCEKLSINSIFFRDSQEDLGFLEPIEFSSSGPTETKALIFLSNFRKLRIFFELN